MKAQKEDRFLRGRRIAYLIYEYFRVTGANDSVENYADLFTISLRSENVQEFDSKWDGILLSMTKIPHDDILEGLYKLRIRESEKLQTVLELYDLEIHQKKAGIEYHRLKTMVKRSVEQNLRIKNFEARNGYYETSAVVKNQRVKKREQRTSLGDCWQWKANGQCSKGDSCSFFHGMNKRGKSSPSNPFSNSFMQQNERKPSRTRSPRGKSPSGRMSRWPCKDYLRGTCHCTSTPHRSETNLIAERAVRRVKEGTSAVLLQSGLNENWWADSMECYTYLRNVTDLLSDGKTPYERRFGQPFKGPTISFGSLVEYHPVTAKDQSRIHQFGKKVLPGLFLGYALYAGGIWKGDVLVADLEELETLDASEIYTKRLKEKGEFIFPIADGRIKTFGGDQDLRTSTLVRHRPIRGEGHVDFLGESEGSLLPPQDSYQDAGEAINDFWSMSGNFIYRHHVEPRVKLYSPREESFPIPLNYNNVSRTTHTNLDVMQESRIDDYWNIDGSRDLSYSWTGFTQFTLLSEKPPNRYMWSRGRLTRKQLTSRPGQLIMARTLDEIGKKCQAEGEPKVVRPD